MSRHANDANAAVHDNVRAMCGGSDGVFFFSVHQYSHYSWLRVSAFIYIYMADGALTALPSQFYPAQASHIYAYIPDDMCTEVHFSVLAIAL